jgi:putative ABC transport system permease protein
MPDWPLEVRKLVEGLSLAPAREAAIVDELAQHLSDRYEELLARGADAEKAYRSVIEEISDGGLGRELKSLELARRRERPAREGSAGWLAAFAKDLRHGGRLLRLDPGFAVVAILSLALGIGANTAIFQLLDAVRLRLLPVANPLQLAAVRVESNTFGRTGNFTGRNPQLTFALWEQLRDEQRAFSSIAAWGSEQLNSSPGGEARYVDVLWVSGGFFATLGLHPRIGRLLSPADDRRGCGSPGVVLSDSFWQREFGGRPSALGRTINLEGHPFEIVGVTPRTFFGVEVGRGFDAALPLCAEPLVTQEKPRIEDRQQWWLSAIGRLRPGWTVEQASAQLSTIARGIFESTLPPQYDAVDAKRYLGFRLEVLSAASGVSSLRRRYESPLWLLLATSGLVLMIACANLANLIVARATVRQREMAVRLALGASRGRLIRQLLAENLLLAVAGAVFGGALAQALSRGLVSFLGTQGSRWSLDLTPDWRVLAFTTALASLTCVVFGLAPALQAARTSPGEAMKSSGRGMTAGRRRLGVRRALVISQVALSLVLLVGALLFVRTLRNLQTVDTGFARDHILVSEIDLSPLKLPVARRTSYKKELLERLRAIPGVLSAADAKIVPVSGSGWNESVNIPGTALLRKFANFNRVTPGYFRTLGTPLLAGRDFSDSDALSAPPVAVVTETFARKFLAGGTPVGRSLAVIQQGGRPDRVYQIVGLVKDTKYADLREDFAPIVFLPAAQDDEPDTFMHVVLRTEQPISGLVASVKRIAADASPALVLNFRVFETTIRESLLRERLMATLSGFFGFLAALLATIGLYGVISYMVVRRRNEIGVRMAMGASRRDVLALILREAGTLLGIGLAIGTGLALLAGSAARTLLFGLTPSDPATIGIAVVSLAGIAAAASFLPAHRAATLDPMQALRED